MVADVLGRDPARLGSAPALARAHLGDEELEDAHAVWPELAAEGLRQRELAAAGDGDGRRVRHVADAAGAADEDVGALAPLAHRRQHVARADEVRLQVVAHHPAPGAQVEVAQIGAAPPAAERGDGEIDPSAIADHLIDQLGGAREVADVALEQHQVRGASRADVVLEGSQLLGAPRGHDDGRAAIDQGADDALADIAGAARDQRRLAFEGPVSHGI